MRKHGHKWLKLRRLMEEMGKLSNLDIHMDRTETAMATVKDLT
jgi:hypothetical protein